MISKKNVRGITNVLGNFRHVLMEEKLTAEVNLLKAVRTVQERNMAQLQKEHKTLLRRPKPAGTAGYNPTQVDSVDILTILILMV